MANESAFQAMFSRAFETLNIPDGLKFSQEMDLERLAVDSVSIQHLLLAIEDETGEMIPDSVLEQLVEQDSVSGFYETLKAHFTAD